MTADVADFEGFDMPHEITDGEGFFQTKAREYSGDKEYQYKLTAFIPAGVTPTNGFPPEAGYWIIPDLNNAVIVSQIKMFKLSFVDKVPAPFKSLYLRVDRLNRPNPTELQEKVWKQVVSNYPGQDGLAKPTQTYLVPILNRFKGEWEATIAEIGVTGYAEIKKANATADDMSDGRINLGTRPVAVWREGTKNFHAMLDKGSDVNVREMIRQYQGELLDPREYVKTRAVATEKFLVEAWRSFKDGSVAEFNTDLTASQRFVDAVTNLTTTQMKMILKENDIKIGKGDRLSLIDLINENQETLEAAVLMVATNEPPL